MANATAAPLLPAAGRSTEIRSPADGEAVALAEVGDGVFSERMLGDGAAVRPTSGHVLAPVSGQVVSVLPHAYGLRTDDGLDVLVHVGIDTVELEGRGFAPRVEQGAEVRAGDPLVQVDLDVLAGAGLDPTVVVVVPTTVTDGTVHGLEPRVLAAGDRLVVVTR
ncbi:MAG TPA: PTS glucose transporter subunit IIA [Cellulomonas sp.]